MSGFIDRCLHIMGTLEINQLELSKKIGKSYKSVNNWFNKRDIIPKTEDAVKIAIALNTTVEYLVTGNDLFGKEDVSELQFYTLIKNDSDLKNFIEDYSLLNVESRLSVMNVIKPTMAMVLSQKGISKKRESSAG